MKDAPVRIVEYDAAWPERFQALARRAARALGDCVLRVEHVGSTSVPGLAAKPVVDLDVVVRPADVSLGIQRLEAIGYTHRGELGIPGRHAFRVPPGEPKHHLYLCVPESQGFRDHLRFRNHLRADPEAAREYAALKRRLADEHGADADAYQRAKSDFIDAVTRRAAPVEPVEPDLRAKMAIKAKAVAVVRHEGRVLVERGYDRVAGSRFYRAIGGHIDFGERAAEAVAREWREEYGLTVEGLALLGVVENLFTYEGRPGHEVVFAFDARVAERTVYERDEVVGVDPDGMRHEALWISLASLADGDVPLSPDGLLELLMQPDPSDG
jgi:GrpB-like predicted nucleotidyltransferase (UPF0157 family)/ADP-ribose pyrophosphatase YjhB (NUDIX family)